MSDNLSYVRGNHSFTFGGEYAQYNAYSFSVNRVVPAITLGLDTNDPANTAMFTASNFPGSSSTDLTNAKNLYALLTGRVTTITASAFTDEENGKYTYLGSFVQRVRQRTLGFYGQDSWRFKSNLTVNAGLRWELQNPYVVLNNNYTQPQGGYAGVWGISGVGNLFKPGTVPGTPTAFVPFPQKTHAYNRDWNNFAPSIGFAWTPKFKSGFLERLAGDSGQTVLRGGYSVAFVREGTDVMNSVIGGNPGGTLSATRSIALGTVTAGTLLRNPAALGPPATPAAPVYPMTLTSAVPYSVSNASNAFIPNLKTGWVQSWSFGIQRELTKDTVIEARYVGTRGKDLWNQYNLNEVNITENGFINEYKLALNNLQQNIAHGCGTTFRYFGAAPTGANAACTGTSPLPIILAHFSGAVDPNNAASYTSSNFSSSTFTAFLNPQNSNAIGFVNGTNALISSLTNRNQATAAGFARNLFLVNPDTFGGAFIVDNSGKSWYDALQIELRRRLSRGLLIQGSYTFSKSLSDIYGTDGAVFYQPRTLRNRSLDKNLSPFDLTHAIKANWIWELPFGRGHSFLNSANGLVDRLAGGWAIHGQARLQSGSTFSFGNVQLVGMTTKDLQKAMKIRKTTDPTSGAGVIFFLPDEIILNTRRAFNTTTTGFSTLGAPTGRYISPANSNGCIQTFTGQCGFANLIMHGPHLTRFDISVVKKTKITESVNFEMRAEFLNAFNNINFKIGSQTAADTSVTNFSGATFGQVTAAYQDLSTTNDVGGRMVQIVLRLNF